MEGLFLHVNKSKCLACGTCSGVCKKNAIDVIIDDVIIDYSLCNRCLECLKTCPLGADTCGERERWSSLTSRGQTIADLARDRFACERIGIDSATSRTRQQEWSPILRNRRVRSPSLPTRIRHICDFRH